MKPFQFPCVALHAQNPNNPTDHFVVGIFENEAQADFAFDAHGFTRIKISGVEYKLSKKTLFEGNISYHYLVDEAKYHSGTPLFAEVAVLEGRVVAGNQFWANAEVATPELKSMSLYTLLSFKDLKVYQSLSREEFLQNVFYTYYTYINPDIRIEDVLLQRMAKIFVQGGYEPTFTNMLSMHDRMASAGDIVVLDGTTSISGYSPLHGGDCSRYLPYREVAGFEVYALLSKQKNSSCISEFGVGKTFHNNILYVYVRSKDGKTKCSFGFECEELLSGDYWNTIIIDGVFYDVNLFCAYGKEDNFAVSVYRAGACGERQETPMPIPLFLAELLGKGIYPLSYEYNKK